MGYITGGSLSHHLNSPPHPTGTWSQPLIRPGKKKKQEFTNYETFWEDWDWGWQWLSWYHFYVSVNTIYTQTHTHIRRDKLNIREKTNISSRIKASKVSNYRFLFLKSIGKCRFTASTHYVLLECPYPSSILQFIRKPCNQITITMILITLTTYY